jgi:hypothetical protein
MLELVLCEQHLGREARPSTIAAVACGADRAHNAWPNDPLLVPFRRLPPAVQPRTTRETPGSALPSAWCWSPLGESVRSRWSEKGPERQPRLGRGRSLEPPLTPEQLAKVDFGLKWEPAPAVEPKLDESQRQHGSTPFRPSAGPPHEPHLSPPQEPRNPLTSSPPEATLRPAPHRAGEVTEWPMVPAC